MKRKTLSSFIPPLYADARTGQIVTTEAQEPTGQDNKEQASMNTTSGTTTLPELGNLPERMPTGTRVTIGKHSLELVRAGKADDDAPQYRLRHNLTLTGNAIFSVDDLNIMGAKLVLDK